MTIPELLREQARTRPHGVAIIDRQSSRDRSITFQELEHRAESFASRLARDRIGKGDAVLVFVPMSIELYVALLGIFRLGAVAVFLDPSAGRAHIEACCEMLPPAAFVGTWKARMLRWLSRPLRKIPRVFRVLWEPSERLSSSTPQDSDPALITFTSGSTGQPKAAIRSHEFLMAQHRALIGAIKLKPGEIDLTTLPVFVLANLASGITSVLPDADMARPGFVDAARIGRQIARLAPTRTGGSPAFYERLADYSEQTQNILAGFQKIYTGGAPVFPRLLDRLQRLAPHAEVVAVYGSTEAEPIAEVAWSDVSPSDLAAMRDGKGLLAGKPVPEIAVRIIADQWGKRIAPLSDEAFGMLAQPIFAPGEIVVTGDHVLKGYLHGEGDEETKFQIGGVIWHRTGDAGYLDDLGRLWLLGRCAARIDCPSGALYPFAVECIAQTFDFIHRSACVAHQEKRLLIVEFHDSPAAEEIDQLKARVAQHVDRVVVARRIPVDRRHNAKVDYPSLQRLLPKLLKQPLQADKQEYEDK